MEEGDMDNIFDGESDAEIEGDRDNIFDGASDVVVEGERENIFDGASDVVVEGDMDTLPDGDADITKEGAEDITRIGVEVTVSLGFSETGSGNAFERVSQEKSETVTLHTLDTESHLKLVVTNCSIATSTGSASEQLDGRHNGSWVKVRSDSMSINESDSMADMCVDIRHNDVCVSALLHVSLNDANSSLVVLSKSV